MPRILILCEYPTTLGGEHSMLATLPFVKAAGFDMLVAAPAVGPLAETLRSANVEHLPWESHDAAGVRLPLTTIRSSLPATFQLARPDLVHANSLSMARISGPVCAEQNRPSIGHLRDILKLSARAIDDLNRHTLLLAVSAATREFHVLQGLDALKCRALHNGVDLSEFQPRQPTGYIHRELDVPGDALLISVIGQLGLRKGTDVALAAALQVAAVIPELHWLIIGERNSNKPESHDFEQHLHSLAAEPPLAGRVHFLGSRGDIAAILNECALLVHAARQEPLGRVLLEAAASGVPVVATNVGGTCEIFPTESDGAMLVPPNDANALSSAILTMAGSRSRRDRMAIEARRRAESHFDIKRAATKLVENYRQVLGS